MGEMYSNPGRCFEYAKFIIIAAPDATRDIRDIVGPYEPGQIFMIDPLGNLMMSYPPGTDMGNVRKDLAHLLKLSGIG